LNYCSGHPSTELLAAQAGSRLRAEIVHMLYDGSPSAATDALDGAALETLVFRGMGQYDTVDPEWFALWTRQCVS